jgi:anaerobic selenocysteine-containing dehydrogenase
LRKAPSEPEAPLRDADRQAPYEPPPEPVSATTKAREFNRGDRVSFDDRNGRVQIGAVVRVNQRTATIDTGDGGNWRVPFHLLRHVLDI